MTNWWGRKIWLLVGALVILVGLSVLGLVSHHRTSQTPTTASQTQSIAPTDPCSTSTATGCQGKVADPLTAKFDPSNGHCQGTGLVPLTASPIPLDQLGLAEPLGQMIGGHVTPIDHGYMFGIHGHQGSKTNEYNVVAPADGSIIGMSATARSGQDNFVDHAITFSLTCTLSVHYLNMDSFDEHILAKTGPITADKGWDGIIPVKAGEVIGHTGPHGIDLFVWNAELTLTGFVKPDQYTAGESWKTHTADPYEYFAEPIKSQILAKDPRLAGPRGGKIDYDVDGRLIGTWFKEGSGGYTGNKQGTEGYWLGHLSIVPDAYDPSGLEVSIGTGKARPSSLASSAPNPTRKMSRWPPA